MGWLDFQCFSVNLMSLASKSSKFLSENLLGGDRLKNSNFDKLEILVSNDFKLRRRLP